MKKLITGYPFALPAALFIVAGSLILAGCTGNDVNGTSEQVSSNSGSAAIDIRVGKVGILAKTTMIEMEKLIIEIAVEGNDSVVKRDTSNLTGHNETVVKKTFPGLTAPEDFTLRAKAIDKTGEVIHAGSVDFSTKPADTVDVSLDLDAQFSMLRVAFNDIPDSVRKVTLGIAAIDTLDSSFTTGSRDTVVLAYDYLAADGDGVDHAISLRASGSFYGKDTVLYAADTSIVARSGVDTIYRVVLKWVGPGVPKGTATMTVTIGTVGTTVINAGFGSLTGEIPTEGLVAYYPFNGNAKDESGNGNDGTVINTILNTNRFGRANSSYFFDDDTYILIHATSEMRPQLPVTISSWILIPSSVPQNKELEIFNNNYENQTYIGVWMCVSIRGHINIGFGDGKGIGNSYCRAKEGTTVLLRDKWYHVVGILQGSNDMAIFLNSINDNGQYYGSGGSLSYSTSSITIGRYGASPNYYGFNGSIDDICFYNRALSESEILALYRENGWTGNP